MTAQSLGTPSAFVSKASDGISRIVVVIGATVTSPRNSNAESLVRISTGRLLSGLENYIPSDLSALHQLPHTVLIPSR